MAYYCHLDSILPFLFYILMCNVALSQQAGLSAYCDKAIIRIVCFFSSPAITNQHSVGIRHQC